MQILQTKDYKIFHHIKGNRPLNQNHIARLTNSIAKNNMLAENPVIVNERFEVIDGQHRLEVAKNNKLDVYYVIKDNTSLADVQQLNTASKPWSMVDFLESFIALGNEDYLELKEYCLETGLSITNAMMMLSGGSFTNHSSFRESNRKSFKEGNWKVLDREYASQMADKLSEIKKVPGVAYLYSDRQFLIAIMKLDKKGDFNRLIEKLNVTGRKIVKQVNIREYLHELEEVYNYDVKIGRVRFY